MVNNINKAIVNMIMDGYFAGCYTAVRVLSEKADQSKDSFNKQMALEFASFIKDYLKVPIKFNDQISPLQTAKGENGHKKQVSSR